MSAEWTSDECRECGSMLLDEERDEFGGLCMGCAGHKDEPAKVHTHDGYGAFPGGDPRMFSPDPECSTGDEREAHRLACEAWTKTEKDGQPPPESKGAHCWVPLSDGYAHIAMCSYGIGVYSIPCTDSACDEALEHDPREPDWDIHVNAERWIAAAREALPIDDEDLGDQDEEQTA